MSTARAGLIWSLALLIPALLGADGCEEVEHEPTPEADADGDGFSLADGDCDDSDPSIHPDAADFCDGIDNDCDGSMDETAVAWYYDGDQDGFGGTDQRIVSCAQPTGYMAESGDCDDTDPAAYPGAADQDGDALDSDCDGSDGPGPSVGLTAATFTTIQAALDAALDGQTVWVGPGTYHEVELTMHGKAVRLASTAGEAATFIDGQDRGTIFIFDSGETSASILQGFTLTNGAASCNTVPGDSWCGLRGGAIFMASASPTLSQVTIMRNSASRYGGGIYLDYSSPTLTQVTLSRNWAGEEGGGMFLDFSSPTLSQVTISGNSARDYGGGMRLSGASPVLSQVTIAGNLAYTNGGGIYMWGSSPIVNNSILAYNTGMTLWAKNCRMTLSYSNLYQPAGTSHNLPSLPETVTELDPGFIAFSPDGDPTNDDLHLRPSSPLIDAGDPSHCSSGDSSGCDPDGGLPDLGVFGGSAADFSYYLDFDQDGLYDGWEQSQTGDLVLLDGQEDSDGDGLSDAEELSLGTDPQQADSDGDGAADGAEVNAARDPLNPCSVPGVDGLVSLVVPSSAYPTVQAALDAIPSGKEGRVQVLPGVYYENLELSHKWVTVEGAGEEVTVLDGQKQGSVWTVEESTLNLRAMTITSGIAEHGGGLRFYRAGGSLEQVTISGNWASGDGGGMYLEHSSPALTQVTTSGNWAYGDGGGMFMHDSSPTLGQVTLSENSACHGGGMFVNDSSPTLNHVTLSGNLASRYGGGMYLDGSSPALIQVTLSGNSASEDGGGMYLYDSSPTLSEVTLSRNSAYIDGGGMYLSSSSPTLSQVTLSENWANRSDGDGGGMYLDESSPTLNQVTLTGNQAKVGGGMFMYDSSPTLSQVTLSGNSAIYGGGMYLNYHSSPTLSQVTLSGNLASRYGGGMYLKVSYLSMSQATLLGNEATYGGGVYLTASSSALNQVTLPGDEVGEDGGGKYSTRAASAKLAGEADPPPAASWSATPRYTDSPSSRFDQPRAPGARVPLPQKSSRAATVSDVSSTNRSTLTLHNSIVAYNRARSGGNLYRYSSSSTVEASSALFYNPAGSAADNFSPSGTFLTVEPQFLAYADSSSGAACLPGSSLSCVPVDLHPALGSPLVDAGDPALRDVDGSRSDLGIYGGPDGDLWNVDGDQLPDYFWPGTWDDAPSGFDPDDYDCDDQDAEVQGCTR